MKDLWIAFVDSVRSLMIASPHDRGLDQYLPVRDFVTELVKDEQFISLLEKTFIDYPINKNTAPISEDRLKTKIVEALKMELAAFPVAVEVNRTTSKPDDAPKAWSERWLGKASTVIGSVKDFVSDSPLKHGLTVYQEVVDLFKGEPLYK